jgi:hypothetical protein
VIYAASTTDTIATVVQDLIPKRKQKLVDSMDIECDRV